jgi:hypothetical protein
MKALAFGQCLMIRAMKWCDHMFFEKVKESYCDSQICDHDLMKRCH